MSVYTHTHTKVKDNRLADNAAVYGRGDSRKNMYTQHTLGIIIII